MLTIKYDFLYMSLHEKHDKLIMILTSLNELIPLVKYLVSNA